MSYAAQVKALHTAIMQQDAAEILPHIKPARADIFSPMARYEVYGFAYAKQLIDATRPDYVTLEHYLGTEEMTKLLQAFVQETPSREWDLNAYTPHFATYLDTIDYDAPARALARLEATIQEVFWMPDSDALDAAMLASLAPEILENTRLTPRKALRLLALDAAANHYLQAYREEHPLTEIPTEKEYLCVVRHLNEVRRLVLEPLEYALLQDLVGGKRFAEAFAQVPEEQAENISTYLSRWIQYGVFTSIS
ncbi:MAG: putative DNA-binding domain-containing protein [Rickettsiales bacterium]